ncbi:HesA/MoeB/ThiF family protein [Dyadobacter sediminis]|uniref:Molybdopterin-synthase adenylyltransferase n=1 Tax=Dyadobacter sediminis TaxID=1493691 RepID=A0A5R9KIB5_9BACT|nr:HesA/MoeB/ThiF family protein [Dyadobacter sediminis]TLU95960.1 molybdopterin-synthase adenylyltransferase MoeB [Dyadobacter sediminis]GGB78093.1 molybdenum cofactor biosynthesis protein MoeB [Dyadobacter sediminis]
MLEIQERKRYSRQILLPEVGLAGQEKLKASKILVVGAGGLGCPVLLYLAAAGAGSLGIVDDDTVDVTNLHRQILYSSDDVGKNKSATAANKLSAINPFVQIHSYPVRLAEENAAEIVSEYDLVIDASDNFPTRYLVNDVCVKLDKPFVFGSILRFEGQVSVFNYHNGPTYRCLFPDAEDGDNCEEAGVIGILPGIIGTYMTNEAIKIICGIGDVLSGKLMLINALNGSVQLFEFARSAAAGDIKPSEPRTAEKPEPAIGELTYEEFESLQMEDPEQVHLVDVREYNEFEADNFGGINIPLSEIPESIASFPQDKKIIFYCQSGKRSSQAARLLLQSGFKGQSFWAKQW